MSTPQREVGAKNKRHHDDIDDYTQHGNTSVVPAMVTHGRYEYAMPAMAMLWNRSVCAIYTMYGICTVPRWYESMCMYIRCTHGLP